MSTTPPKPLRLLSLPVSLYNDFARWALDSSGVAYEERRQALMVHVISSRVHGGAGTTPMLLGAGRKLADSTAIAEWADARAPKGHHLYPRDVEGYGEAREFVAGLTGEFGEADPPHGLGIPARRHPDADADLVRRGAELAGADDRSDVEGGQAARQARSRPRRQSSSPRRPRRWRRSSIGLPSGSPTAARSWPVSTSASTTSPSRRWPRPRSARPTGYPAPHFQPEDFPQVHADRIRAFREHPAGAYAMRMYAEHRTPATPGAYG